jgi:tRNA A58 N-methylase Trm61
VPTRDKRVLLRSAVTFLAAAVIVTPSLSAQTRLAPFVVTPSDVVDRMLGLAGVGPRDTVYDLGSGDGRIVITAARTFGARGVGLDIDPMLVERATANAKAAGVGDRVSFRLQDAMTADVSDATVVTLYLLPSLNLKLLPKLNKELKPGTRIVSHAFDMGTAKPVQTLNVNGRTIYYWTIPIME